MALERMMINYDLWLESLPWRNDPLVYAWTRTNRVIDLDEHKTWWEERKSRLEKEPVFAYFDKNSFVGLLRLDLRSPLTYEVGLIVNPSFRGFGYGKAMLFDICEYLSAERFANFEILAFVHAENAISRSLFESFNFVKSSRVGLFDILKKENQHSQSKS